MASGQFEVIDYVIFALSLALSASIGIYFTFWGSKKKTENDYLYGDRKMKGIPVGLSLYSSAISAVSIIGIPMEIYYYGLQYIIGLFGKLSASVIIIYVLVPIFCGNLNIKTPYEYFERRFDVKVKILSTIIYLIHTFLLMPVIIYTPSMALSQVTQIPVLVCSSLVGGICILYTAFGGFKSVIWTDSLQATLMLISCLVIAVLGVNNAGGVSAVWSQALDGGRTNLFDMNPDPFQRTTFWTAWVGSIFIYLAHCGCSVGALQRYMSLENPTQANVSVLVGCGSMILISCIGAVTGLAMYAVYHSCDPFLHKDISTPNQILPFFVTNSINYIPGLSGFFIAGLLCAALSTLSSELNAVGGIIYFDVILKIYKNNFIESNGPFIMKIIVVITGIIYLVAVPLVQQSSHIYELSVSIIGITYGAKLGVMFLAILCPRCNTKGAMTGAFVSMIIMVWICYAANSYKVNSYYTLDIRADNCSSSNSVNQTITTAINSTAPINISRPKLDDIFILYKLSYQYTSLFGTLITVTVAIIVSYFTESSHMRTLDPLLIAPFLRPYLLKQQPIETT